MYSVLKIDYDVQVLQFSIILIYLFYVGFGNVGLVKEEVVVVIILVLVVFIIL